MEKSGPIIIIDDDKDDQELIDDLFRELNIENEIRLFSTGPEALKYLSQPDVKPFLIISDINMPTMDGFELRSFIHKHPELDKKCIPYLFITTGASRAFVEQAYSLSVQGIFQKPVRYEKWKEMIAGIVHYWSDCISPNNY
jgi:CheY-like chemotaxis protein